MAYFISYTKERFYYWSVSYGVQRNNLEQANVLSYPTDPFTILEPRDPSIDNKLPTNIFTILEPLDQEIGECYVLQERRVTDFEAPKLWKGSSGFKALLLCKNRSGSRAKNPTETFTIVAL